MSMTKPNNVSQTAATPQDSSSVVSSLFQFIAMANISFGRPISEILPGELQRRRHRQQGIARAADTLQPSQDHRRGAGQRDPGSGLVGKRDMVQAREATVAVDPREFRDALGMFPTGVAIMTTARQRLLPFCQQIEVANRQIKRVDAARGRTLECLR
jgi:hypothetical protein